MRLLRLQHVEGRFSGICEACWHKRRRGAPREKARLLLLSTAPASSNDQARPIVYSRSPAGQLCELCESPTTLTWREGGGTVCDVCEAVPWMPLDLGPARGHAAKTIFGPPSTKPTPTDDLTHSLVATSDSTARVCALCGSPATPKWRGWGGNICNVCGLAGHRAERASAVQTTPAASCPPSRPGHLKSTVNQEDLPFQTIGEGVKRRADRPKGDTHATFGQWTNIRVHRQRSVG